MPATLITYNGSNVTAKDDAILREITFGDKGIIQGINAYETGGNQIIISPGYGIITGRLFYEAGETRIVPLTQHGTIPGQMFYKMDLSRSDKPIELIVETGNDLTELIDGININYNDGTAYLKLAIFAVNDTGITQFEYLNPTLSVGSLKQILINQLKIAAIETKVNKMRNADPYAVQRGFNYLTFSPNQLQTIHIDLTKFSKAYGIYVNVENGIPDNWAFTGIVDSATKARVFVKYKGTTTENNIKVVWRVEGEPI